MVENRIVLYMHCKQCVNELLEDPSIEQSPMEYAQLQPGMTPDGFQIWCRRHNCNVIYINLETGEVSDEQ